jgi:hypothetical protein
VRPAAGVGLYHRQDRGAAVHGEGFGVAGCRFRVEGLGLRVEG